MKYAPCKYCGSQPVVELQKATCTGCGAATISFVGTGGDCHREDDFAMYAWQRGEYFQKHQHARCDNTTEKTMTKIVRTALAISFALLGYFIALSVGLDGYIAAGALHNDRAVAVMFLQAWFTAYVAYRLYVIWHK